MEDMEELFMKVMANMKSKESINGDLTLFSKANSRNKEPEYKAAGKEYCDKSFNEGDFGKEIQSIIDEIDSPWKNTDLSNLTKNFTLVPGIYEEGMGDGNFPKIRKGVLEKLNELFFEKKKETLKTTKISTEKGINLLNNSFIRKKKNDETGGSEIVMEDKFYREKLSYSKMSGKLDVKKRVELFKSGIGAVLKSIATNKKKNYFLVSHSKFMQALYKSICDTNQVPYFDHLDVLHLIVREDGILVKGIYRWKESYQLGNQSFFGKCTGNSTGAEGEYLNLFMMRHCVACHNVVSNSKKILQKGLLRKNYGSTSMCLRLVEDLYQPDSNGSRKIMGLIKMLKENTGTNELIESINFGSSVSLRTTLTGLVVQRMIALNTTPGNEAIQPTGDAEAAKAEAAEAEADAEIKAATDKAARKEADAKAKAAKAARKEADAKAEAEADKAVTSAADAQDNARHGLAHSIMIGQ